MTTNATPLGPVTQTPTGSIRGAGDNPRVITKAAIDMVAKSIARFGWQQPIVVDREGIIVAGHTRHLAAKQLGLSSVPVVVAEGLTPDEARAYRIADNRTGDFTSWDYPELVDQLDDLSAGFSDELALADWQSIVGQFESAYGDGGEHVDASGDRENATPAPPTASNTTKVPTPHHGAESAGDWQIDTENAAFGAHRPAHTGEVADLVVPDLAARQLEADYELVVVCDGMESRANAQEALLRIEGVVDVRYKR